jgi:integrase
MVKHCSKLTLVSFENMSSLMSFKVARQEVNKDYLTPDEVIAIKSLNYAIGSKERDIQQMFLFAYFTALRISDVRGLEQKHIFKKGKDIYLKKLKIKSYQITLDITLVM